MCYYIRSNQGLLLEKILDNGDTVWTDDAKEAKKFKCEESANDVARANVAKVITL